MRSPKKRTALFALATIIFACTLAAFLFKSPPEPSYKGETVNAWLDDMVRQPFSKPKHDFGDYHAAMHAMGPPAIPFIIHKLNQNDSPWRNKYRERWPNLPPFWQSHLPKPKDISFEAGSAEMAFSDLGPRALPYLLPKMHDSSPAVREAVMSPVFGMYLSTHSPNETVALFIPVLKDSDPMVRLQVILALSRIGAAVSNAVPALINALQSDEVGRHYGGNERVYVRANTARILGKMGPAATAAVPP